MSLKSMISRLPWIGSAVGKSASMDAMFNEMMATTATRSGELVQPYARSAWVRSAISFVAQPIAMRPLVITADRRGGDVPVEDADLTAFWERPAKTCAGVMSRQDFFEATVGLLKLKGQCFWIMDDSWGITTGRPTSPRSKNPLILARHDQMHAIIENGELLGWSYTDKRGGRNALLPEQVEHLKFWNPYHDWMGLSEWESAMLAAESDYASGVFARNLSKNNGDRGPFVIGKQGSYSDDQIKQVTAQLRAKRELGRRGDFRAMFLPADVDVVEPGLKAVDSEFVNQRLENRKEIYMAFGVPPSFADPQASYSIGSASDRFRLIEDTCMPLGAKIADASESVSQKFLGTDVTLFVDLDWDSHSTMQQVRSERFETATKAVDRGMPWRVAGDFFDLGLPRFAGDHIGRIPFNLTEIEPDAEEQAGGSAADDKATDAIDDLEKLFRAAPVQATEMQSAKPEKTATKRSTEIWQRVRRNREPWEKKFKAKISRYLMDARAETLRNLANAQAPEGKAIVAKDLDLLSILFDLDAWLPKWTQGLLGISRAAIEQAGIELWRDELERDDPLTMPADEVLEALSVRENKIKGAGTKVWEAIKTELEQGIFQGETTDQLAQRVRAKFSGMEKTRALTIAKTETTVIYEQGRDMTFRAAGVEWTEWVCSGLDASRHNTYPGLNGQRREMGQKFEVGLAELAFPGDPDGPPDEVINCNCVRIAVGGPDAGDIIGNEDDEIPY